MHVLITGADRPLGRAAVQHLAGHHDLRLCGRAPADEVETAGQEYRRADLTEPETAPALAKGVDAVLHLENHDPEPPGDAVAECELIRRATLGTYFLMQAARAARVDRVILAGTLAVYKGYPEDYVVDERWKPRPPALARSLAPYLAETSAREFPREGGPRAVCLRFGPIGEGPEQTTLANVLHAIDCALDMRFEPDGYRFHIFNIGNSTRYLCREARIFMDYRRAKEAD